MTLTIVQILSILVLAWPSACENPNDFGEDVNFNCPPGHAIDTIESTQISNMDKRRKRTDDYDRAWDFDCIQVSLFLCVSYHIGYSYLSMHSRHANNTYIPTCIHTLRV